jgi:hypothetical protein
VFQALNLEANHARTANKFMNSFKEYTQVFIVRVWREPRERKGARPEWRGVIEHVPDGERCYVRDLDDISTFIAPYLEMMGVRFGFGRRVRTWLKRRKLFSTKSC